MSSVQNMNYCKVNQVQIKSRLHNSMDAYKTKKYIKWLVANTNISHRMLADIKK